jgi:hypothetical protein
LAYQFQTWEDRIIGRILKEKGKGERVKVLKNYSFITVK